LDSNLKHQAQLVIE